MSVPHDFDQQADAKKLTRRIVELEAMMIEDPTPPPPTGNHDLVRQLSRGRSASRARGQSRELPIDIALDICSSDLVDHMLESGPDETIYMNRSNGRIQMYYESTDHLWDEETY